MGDVVSPDGARLLTSRSAVTARERTARGDIGWFTSFYREALPQVYSYLANRCASRAIAEDLVHDCFLAALAAKQAGSDVTVAWMMRVARNKLVDHYRRDDVRRRHFATPHALIRDEVVMWQGESSRDRALDVLAHLSGDHRAVLVLRHMDGLPVPEIAALLQRSVHATESLLVRAKAEFKRRYQEGRDD